MEKVTNYAVLRNKSSPPVIYVEVTGSEDLLLCNYTGLFVRVRPRCIVPTVVDEFRAKDMLETKPKGTVLRVFGEPYEVVHWNTRRIYCFSYRFGFKVQKTGEILGVTPLQSADIL